MNDKDSYKPISLFHLEECERKLRQLLQEKGVFSWDKKSDFIFKEKIKSKKEKKKTLTFVHNGELYEMDTSPRDDADKNALMLSAVAIRDIENTLKAYNSGETNQFEFYLASAMKTYDEARMAWHELDIERGRNRFGWQSSGGKENATPKENITRWKNEYAKLKADNPNISKRKAAKLIDPEEWETVRKNI